MIKFFSFKQSKLLNIVDKDIRFFIGEDFYIIRTKIQSI